MKPAADRSTCPTPGCSRPARRLLIAGLLLTAVAVSPLPLAGQPGGAPAAVESSAVGQFRVEFTPVPGARFYEIEWFREDVAGQSNPIADETERFDAPPFLKRVRGLYKFFRVRSIGQFNLPGDWTPLFTVPGFTNRKVKQEIFRNIERADGVTVRYFTGQSIQLQAEDDSPEPSTIYYSVNNGPFQQYDQRVLFKEDGSYILRYYAIDAAGNKEAMQQARFLVDRKPPQTSVRFESGLVENERGLFTGPNNTIYLDAADAGAGVEKIRYRIVKTGESRGAFRDYTAPIQIARDVLGDSPRATYAIEFYAIDRLGNREERRTIYVRQSDFEAAADA